LKSQIESESIEEIGKIINQNWELKVQLADNISDDEISSIYKAGLTNGATGGKLLGAGAGGFMMFFAKPEYHEKIENALSGYKRMYFRITTTGAQVFDLSVDSVGDYK
jgi:D-glycero-alpha-D-manno-heptose-7-phosphate kinase